MAVGDLQRAADIVTDSIATSSRWTTRGRPSRWLAPGSLASGPRDSPSAPSSTSNAFFLLATRGQREAERWLVAFDQAHPSRHPRSRPSRMPRGAVCASTGETPTQPWPRTPWPPKRPTGAVERDVAPRAGRASPSGSGSPHPDGRPRCRRWRPQSAYTATQLTDRRRGPLARRAPVDPVPAGGSDGCRTAHPTAASGWGRTPCCQPRCRAHPR